MKRLVIAAHPDDEVLGCGGTIARLVAEGDEIGIAIFGEGLRSRADSEVNPSADEIDRLHKISEEVAARLGAKEFTSFRFPDNRFDSVPMLEIVKAIEGLIEKFSPEVVYTHSGGDLNVDHSVLHRATLTATRPLSSCPVKEVYAFEVASSSEWAFQQLAPQFTPNVFVEISNTLETKIECMQRYESEAREAPHPRSPESLRAIAGRWGSVAGFASAEAFQLLRACY